MMASSSCNHNNKRPRSDAAAQREGEKGKKAQKRGAIARVEPRQVFDLLTDREGVDRAVLDAIELAFERDGLVVIRLHDEAECRARIKEQVKEILLKQPWSRLLVVRDPATQRVLDIDADEALYIQTLTSPNLPRAVLKEWTECWTLHAGFGAACDPQVFHLPLVWMTRQDPRLYAVASRLLAHKALWVDINRSIQKLPGQGDDEMLHWDQSPFAKDADWSPPSSLPLAHRALHCKVMDTEARLVCVLDTATEEFRQRFIAEYGPLYPNAKGTAAKFGLDESKADPLRLFDRRVAVRVPAGCAVMWRPELAHGVRAKSKDEAIEFGNYAGFFPAGSRARYAKLEGGLTELDDRLASYRQGRAPRRWPSFDAIHYFPARYLNFHRMLEPFVAKTRADWPGLSWRVIKSGPNQGAVVSHLAPVPDPAYVPPPLSELGERLLGLRAWA